MNRLIKYGVLSLPIVLLLVALQPVSAVEQPPAGMLGELGAKVFAAAIAFGLAAIAAGIAISGTGSAGLAAATERPEMRTMALIVLAFAESLAIYGIAVAFFILGI